MAKVKKPWWATIWFRVIVLYVSWNLIERLIVEPLIARGLHNTETIIKINQNLFFAAAVYYGLGYVILHAALRPKSE